MSIEMESYTDKRDMLDGMGIGPTLHYMINNDFPASDERYAEPLAETKMLMLLLRMGLMNDTEAMPRITFLMSNLNNIFLSDMGYKPRISLCLPEMNEDIGTRIKACGLTEHEYASRAEEYVKANFRLDDGSLNMFMFEKYVYDGSCQILLEELGYA